MNEINFNAGANLVKDPEISFDQHLARTTLRLAVHSRYRSSTGQWTLNNPTYLDAVVWGAMAERVAETLAKGDRVVVRGRPTSRFYTPTEGPRAGKELQRLEVVVDEIGPSLAFSSAVIERNDQRVDA